MRESPRGVVDSCTPGNKVPWEAGRDWGGGAWGRDGAWRGGCEGGAQGSGGEGGGGELGEEGAAGGLGEREVGVGGGGGKGASARAWNTQNDRPGQGPPLCSPESHTECVWVQLARGGGLSERPGGPQHSCRPCVLPGSPGPVHTSPREGPATLPGPCSPVSVPGQRAPWAGGGPWTPWEGSTPGNTDSRWVGPTQHRRNTCSTQLLPGQPGNAGRVQRAARRRAGLSTPVACFKVYKTGQPWERSPWGPGP